MRRLRCIVLLACGKREAHRTSQAANGQMYFGAQAAARAAKSSAPFFSPGSVLVGSDDGGIDDQVFEVRVIGYRFKDPPPNTLDAPSTEAPKHAVPIPEEDRARESPYARSKAHLPRTSGCRGRSNPSGQAYL